LPAKLRYDDPMDIKMTKGQRLIRFCMMTLFCLVARVGMAQTMTVYMGDSVLVLDVNRIDRIVFEEASAMEAVDMGLSVKWAACNLGAEHPEDWGDYYAWGETETKDNFTWETYDYYVPTFSSAAKPTLALEEYDDEPLFMDDSIPCMKLRLENDAAHAVLGGAWRMPTAQEQQELIDGCTWEWVTVNDVTGFKVTAKNGNQIFLPAAGAYFNKAIDRQNEVGYYWSSTALRYAKAAGRSYFLQFLEGGYNWQASRRYIGFPIRAVKKE